MNVRDELLLQYSYLTDGESEAGQLCPVCRGGGSGEHSLSITRDGSSLLWKCHRNSCGFSGGSGSKASAYGGRTRATVSRGMVGRTYLRTAEVLPASVADELKETYHFTLGQLAELGWNEETQRVVIPVRDWDGELLGSVLRVTPSYQVQKGEAKAKSHTEDDAVATFRNYDSEDVIIVEDCYSALRASKYMNACAILGTYLHEPRIEAIKVVKPKRAFLALDNDAFANVIKYVKRFRNDLPMIPVKLGKDLKDLTPQELKEFFDAL